MLLLAFCQPVHEEKCWLLGGAEKIPATTIPSEKKQT